MTATKISWCLSPRNRKEECRDSSREFNRLNCRGVGMAFVEVNYSNFNEYFPAGLKQTIKISSNGEGDLPPFESTFTYTIKNPVYTDMGFTYYNFDTMFLYVKGKFDEGYTSVIFTNGEHSLTIRGWKYENFTTGLNDLYSEVTGGPIRAANNNEIFFSSSSFSSLHDKVYGNASGIARGILLNTYENAIYARCFIASDSNYPYYTPAPIAYNTDTSEYCFKIDSTNVNISFPLMMLFSHGYYKVMYSISINNPDVGGTATADKETAQAGDTVTVTLTPATGYAAYWQGTTITSTVAVAPVWDSDNVFHFTMPEAEVTINPAFQAYHTISVQQSTGGTCTVSRSSAVSGTTITATLNAATDYSIDTANVKVKDPLQNELDFTWDSGTTLTFTMPQSNVTVYPAWRENQYYTVTIGRVTGGTITASKQTRINPGETITLTCTPDNGYHVEKSNIHAYMGIESLSLNWIDETHCELTMPPTASTILTIIVTGTFRAGNPYIPGGDSDEGSGGGGTYDGTSDTIPVPDVPLIQMTDTGLLRLFKPSSAQAKAFGSFLWSDLISWDTVTKLFTDPIESVISFHMIPITPDTGANVEVKFMGVSSGVSMPPLTSQYHDIFLGNVRIEEYYGSFLDYSPLTRISLYLPYIGETELNTDEVMGRALGIYYRVDALSGACVAYVTVDGNVMYQYAGNCLIPIPLSQSNYGRIIGAGLAVVNTGLSLLSGAGTMLNGAGGALSGLSGVLSGTANTVRNGLEMASPVTNALQGKRAGGHVSLGSGIAGLFSTQYPYLTITRPRQSLASGFNHFQGYPANISGKLSEQSGYIKINSIDLTGIVATESELSELRDILRGGIYV